MNNSAYRKDIDGLRTIAVLPVLLFHAGFNVFSGGYVGVDVFFVISGFLITTLIIKDYQADRFTLVEFYERRARRILPALFLVMLVSLPLAWTLMLPKQFKEFFDSIIAAALSVSNIFFYKKSGYFEDLAEEKPLLHTWSLGVEEQYYIFFPLLLGFVLRKRPSLAFPLIVLFALLSLGLSQYALQHFPVGNYYLLPTRAWELLIGSAGACILLKRNAVDIMGAQARSALSLLGLALIAVPVFHFDQTTPFPGIYALPPTIGTLLIILFSSNDNFVGRLLSLRAMVYIGTLSYSIYLWHQPLFAFFRIYSIDHPSPYHFLSLLGLTLFLSFLTHRYVETPFRRRTFMQRATLFKLSGGIAAVFCAAGVAGHVGQGFPSRLDAQAMRYASYTESRYPLQVSCWAKVIAKPEPGSACSLGVPGKPTVALWGDSHAGSMVLALDEKLKALGQSGVNYSLKACPPVIGIHSNIADRDQRACAEYRKNVFESLKASSSIDTVVLIARWSRYVEGQRFDNGEGGIEEIDGVVWSASDKSDTDNKRAMLRAYTATIDALLKTGKKVILVYPVPEMGWNVPTYLTKEVLRKQARHVDLSTSYKVFEARHRLVNAAFDQLGTRDNLVRVRPSELFCNNYQAGRCVAQLKGVPLYCDDDHLSTEGATYVVEAMKQSLRPSEIHSASLATH